jgi:hypothetical protein
MLRSNPTIWTAGWGKWELKWMLLGHGHSYLEGIDEELTGHEGDGGAIAAA